MKRIHQKSHLLLWLLPLALAALVHPHLRDDRQHLEWLAIGLVLYALFFSVVVHELCHGLGAAACGDETAAEAGRLTFNPIRHVSLVGSILVPLGLYLINASVVLGWAKPVPFNPVRLRRHPRDQVFLAFAGPISNFVLSYLSFNLYLGAAFLYNRLHPGGILGVHWDIFSPVFIETGPLAGIWFVLFTVLSAGILINLVLGVFNLIPFPPLDGFWLLKALLPKKAAALAGKVQIFGFILIILALHFNLLTAIFYPMITGVGLMQMIASWCLR